VPDEEVLRRRNAWRRDHPRTVKFWGELNRAAIHAVRKKGHIFPCGKVSFVYDDIFLFMRLPSGRRIAYPFARLETNSRGDLVVIHKISDNRINRFKVMIRPLKAINAVHQAMGQQLAANALKS